MINTTTKSLLLNSILLGLLCTATINFGMDIEFETSSESSRGRSNDESSTSRSRSPSPCISDYVYRDGSECTIEFNKENVLKLHKDDILIDPSIYNSAIIRTNNHIFIKTIGIYCDQEKTFKEMKPSKQKLIPYLTPQEFQSTTLSTIQPKEIMRDKTKPINVLAVITDKNGNSFLISDIINKTNINLDDDEKTKKIIDEIMRENDTQTNQEKIKTYEDYLSELFPSESFSNKYTTEKLIDLNNNQKKFSTESTNEKNKTSYSTKRTIVFGCSILSIFAAIIYFAYKNNLSISDLFKKFSSSSTTT